MIYWLLLIVVSLLVITVVLILKYKRSKRNELLAIRAKWGKPKFNTLDLEKVSAYFETAPPAGSITKDIANDIDLEGVFEFIDRTNSCVGQQYLYKQLY